MTVSAVSCSVLVMTENETPRRSVRVPDERWDRYGEIVAAQGSNASAALNEHMQSVIDNHEEGASK